MSVLGAIVAFLSCDQASRSAQDASAGPNDECPIGTFRPVGGSGCVFPATDQFGNAFQVSDNRCTPGQPAFPPSCVSDQGARAYFVSGTSCAPGYRYAPGACLRSGPTGVAGTSGPGIAGTGFIASDGVFGVAGTTGSDGTGFSSDGTTGSAGAH